MEGIDAGIFNTVIASPREADAIDFNLEVFIEIAKGSHVKYEYDKKKKSLVCDRVLRTPFKYGFNYGFIPNTLSEDGDPLDVVVIMDDELIPGCYISCRLVGVLETKDDAGVDPKLIMVPSTKVDPMYISCRNMYDINPSTRDKIRYFFTHYKDLEGKKVDVGLFRNKDDAIAIYNESVSRFVDKVNSLSGMTILATVPMEK
jgi:inorganic pyrophosphatase